jgi:hypothetical protein
MIGEKCGVYVTCITRVVTFLGSKPLFLVTLNLIFWRFITFKSTNYRQAILTLSGKIIKEQQ